MAVRTDGMNAAFSGLLSDLFGGLLAEAPWEDFLRSLALYLDEPRMTAVVESQGEHGWWRGEDERKTTLPAHQPMPNADA